MASAYPGRGRCLRAGLQETLAGLELLEEVAHALQSHIVGSKWKPRERDENLEEDYYITAICSLEFGRKNGVLSLSWRALHFDSSLHLNSSLHPCDHGICIYKTDGIWVAILECGTR